MGTPTPLASRAMTATIRGNAVEHATRGARRDQTPHGRARTADHRDGRDRQRCEHHDRTIRVGMGHRFPDVLSECQRRHDRTAHTWHPADDQPVPVRHGLRSSPLTCSSSRLSRAMCSARSRRRISSHGTRLGASSTSVRSTCLDLVVAFLDSQYAAGHIEYPNSRSSSGSSRLSRAMCSARSRRLVRG